MLTVSKAWQTTYPGAAVGVLAMDQVIAPRKHPGLAKRKAELEEALRARFKGWSRSDLKELPAVQPYVAYYKRFKKSYHLLLQLESVAFKNKSIPRVAPLVEAMFMAELKNQLLTAGHDLAKVEPPVTVRVAAGDEAYTTMGGSEQILKEGDMYIADTRGVISSIIYGPDRRARIRPSTTQLLFTVYAPQGVGNEAVESHLRDIEDNILLIAPEAKVTERSVYGA
jgi:DNA/RNA-binding domain of Phe-tRNA-synthetase-like protein